MAPVTIVEADDQLWTGYDVLATRAYGHPVPDITHLAPHADRRVALREGRVIAGGWDFSSPSTLADVPCPQPYCPVAASPRRSVARSSRRPCSSTDFGRYESRAP